jgi:hypothetical protein
MRPWLSKSLSREVAIAAGDSLGVLILRLMFSVGRLDTSGWSKWASNSGRLSSPSVTRLHRRHRPRSARQPLQSQQRSHHRRGNLTTHLRLLHGRDLLVVTTDREGPGPSTTHSTRRIVRVPHPTPSFAEKSRFTETLWRLDCRRLTQYRDAVGTHGLVDKRVNIGHEAFCRIPAWIRRQQAGRCRA